MSTKRILTSGFAGYRTRQSGTKMSADIRMVIVWGKRNLRPGDHTNWGNEIRLERLPNGQVQLYRTDRMANPGFWASIFIGWLNSSRGTGGPEARRTMVAMSRESGNRIPLPA